MALRAKNMIEPGMRVRLTRNLDKERGFVNGALGTAELVLRKDVFVLVTDKNMRILVHPVHGQQGPFLPCVYGSALTIRRLKSDTLLCCFLTGNGLTAATPMWQHLE